MCLGKRLGRRMVFLLVIVIVSRMNSFCIARVAYWRSHDPHNHNSIHSPLTKGKCSKKIKKILKRSKEAIVIILYDDSQAPEMESGIPIEFQKEENKIILKEVVRSHPILTEASKLFQR